jgi:hypothetical protein
MFTRDQLAAEIATNLVRALCDMCLHTHKQGIDGLFINGKRKAIGPLEARKHFAAWLNHHRVHTFVSKDTREACSRPPEEAGPMDTAEVSCRFEIVETYLWIGRLRAAFPSFTATKPPMWAQTGLLASAAIDSWWSRVKLREESELIQANRLAAAWRWRAEIGGLNLPLRQYSPLMRRYVIETRKLIPVAARFAAKKGWMKPERNDFPVYFAPRLSYSDNLDWEERQQLECLARARSLPLRRVLDVDGSLSPENDIDAAEAWSIMAGRDKLAKHPQFPA